jgi:hypothetical protein
MPGAYHRVEYLKGASLGRLLVIFTNTRLGWKGFPWTKILLLITDIRLARDKHSCLLRKSINYGRNNFYDTDPRAQCYKTFSRPYWNSTFFAVSLIIEGTKEKVLQFIMPLKSVFNQNLGFIEQKNVFLKTTGRLKQ